MDKAWFDWLCNINQLRPSQFVWIDAGTATLQPRAVDLLKNKHALADVARAIGSTQNVGHVQLKPFMFSKAYTELLDRIEAEISQSTVVRVTRVMADEEWCSKFQTKDASTET